MYFDESHFPLLRRIRQNGQTLHYLDNASTTHKPDVVIQSMFDFYQYHNSNVYRGAYELAEQTTTLYEEARNEVASFIGASDASNIVFTSGTTDSINMVMYSWGLANVKKGDVVIITDLEHHSNSAPWIWLAQHVGATLVTIPVISNGMLDYDCYDHNLNERVKLVAIGHGSNALGTYNDLQYIINAAHRYGARVLIDAAQSVGRKRLNVQALGADFVAFSGHKMLGPLGIGVLYYHPSVQDEMRPFKWGGGMVTSVDVQELVSRPWPYGLEAGTPPIAQAIGLREAIRYINKHVCFDRLEQHEALLTRYAFEHLSIFPEVTLLGPLQQLEKQGHMVNFVIKGFHPHDVATFLDQRGVCVRAGNHCAQLLAKRLGYDGWVRASFYGYTSLHDVQALIQGVRDLLTL